MNAEISRMRCDVSRAIAKIDSANFKIAKQETEMELLKMDLSRTKGKTETMIYKIGKLEAENQDLKTKIAIMEKVAKKEHPRVLAPTEAKKVPIIQKMNFKNNLR